MPGGHLEAPIGDNLANITDPPGSGGLLAALHLWRRLLVLGPERFGDLQYLGTVPLVTSQELVDRRAIMLLGQDREPHAVHAPELCDALVGTYGGVSCRFIYDARTGNLAALEMFRGPDDDPCEIYFTDYAEIEGRVFPRQIECRYGDASYLTVKLTGIKLDKGSGE
jgi:serine protease Do